VTGGQFELIPHSTEAVASQIVDAALQVHRALGPGLLESAYEICLCHELSKRCIAFERQRNWPIVYENVRLESGLRLDLIVDNQIVVEIKSVEQMIPLYESQLLTCLKLTGMRIGFLINFNVPLLKEGIKRFVR
jgi:GxxExxY protein